MLVTHACHRGSLARLFLLLVTVSRSEAWGNSSPDGYGGMAECCILVFRVRA